MKTLFIPAKSEIEIEPLLKKVKLKGKTGILTTIQHLDKVKKLKGFIFGGQVLGCNAINARKIQNKVDQFLYIGSGRFHPIEIALETNKPVYTLNPFTKEFKELNQKDIDKIRKKIKGAYLKYLTSNKIGIIISSKTSTIFFTNKLFILILYNLAFPICLVGIIILFSIKSFQIRNRVVLPISAPSAMSVML